MGSMIIISMEKAKESRLFVVKGQVDRVGVVSVSSYNSLPTEGSHNGEGSTYHDSYIMRCETGWVIQCFTRVG